LLTTPLSKDPQTSFGPPAPAAAADSFLYTWSELGLTPVDWCRFGLVVQRSKAYETEFDIQRGFFAGVGVSF
jgi:hypothetical protein